MELEKMLFPFLALMSTIAIIWTRRLVESYPGSDVEYSTTNLYVIHGTTWFISMTGIISFFFGGGKFGRLGMSAISLILGAAAVAGVIQAKGTEVAWRETTDGHLSQRLQLISMIQLGVSIALFFNSSRVTAAHR